jgi:hypothetical protein
LDGLAGVADGWTRVEVVGQPRDVPTSVGLALYRVIEAAADEMDGRTAMAVTVRYLPDAIEVDLVPASGVPRTWPTMHMREWARLCESEPGRRTTQDGESLSYTVLDNAGAYA